MKNVFTVLMELPSLVRNTNGTLERIVIGCARHSRESHLFGMAWSQTITNAILVDINVKNIIDSSEVNQCQVKWSNFDWESRDQAAITKYQKMCMEWHDFF